MRTRREHAHATRQHLARERARRERDPCRRRELRARERRRLEAGADDPLEWPCARRRKLHAHLRAATSDILELDPRRERLDDRQADAERVLLIAADVRPDPFAVVA